MKQVVYLIIFLMLLTLIAVSTGFAATSESSFVMKKVEPENGEIMVVESAPVDDIYVNDINEKVQKKLQLILNQLMSS